VFSHGGFEVAALCLLLLDFDLALVVNVLREACLG
jgi:hypothetical protein